MTKNALIILLFLPIAILSGVPESFARPQYLSNLTAVYGDGSCGTCHVTNGSGQRDFNGTVGQHNSSNGTFERRDTNRTARSSNGTFRQRSSNRTLPLNPYGTLFENQPDHDTNPSAALKAISSPTTDLSDTSKTGTGTQAAPGFEIVVSLFGLFAGSLLARGHNK